MTPDAHFAAASEAPAPAPGPRWLGVATPERPRRKAGAATAREATAPQGG